MRLRLLALAAFALPGCYALGSLGYGQPGGIGQGEAAWRIGMGSLRDDEGTAHPEVLFRGQIASPGVGRVGFGPSAMVPLLELADHPLAPAVRLQLPMELQFGKGGPAPVLSPGAEALLVWLPRSEEPAYSHRVFTLGLGVEDHIDLARGAHAFVGTVRFGVGFSLQTGVR